MNSQIKKAVMCHKNIFNLVKKASESDDSLSHNWSQRENGPSTPNAQSSAGKYEIVVNMDSFKDGRLEYHKADSGVGLQESYEMDPVEYEESAILNCSEAAALATMRLLQLLIEASKKGVSNWDSELYDVWEANQSEIDDMLKGETFEQNQTSLDYITETVWAELYPFLIDPDIDNDHTSTMLKPRWSGSEEEVKWHDGHNMDLINFIALYDDNDNEIMKLYGSNYREPRK